MKTRLLVPARQCATTLTYKHLFLFTAVFGGCYFIMSLRYGIDFSGDEKSNMLLLPEYFRNYQDDNHFTIRTEGCTISALDPFDNNVKDFVKYPKELKPCSFGNLTLLDSNDTHIFIVRSNLNYYNISEYGTFNCCYAAFGRPDMILDIKSRFIDDRVNYKNCINFVDSVKVSDEFVKVTCSYLDEEIYEDFFLFAPRKAPSDSVTTNNINLTTYNVIILGIDAVSRMNFHRTMPKTLALLQKFDAVELAGYNKVGDNTFPNVVPLLLGISENELKKTCLPNSHSTFDNCPFIWQWFKDAGYYTALGEDSAKLGTFNYLKVGFSGTPTDYYLYTFMHESENNIGNNKDFNSYLCMGDKFYYRVLLDYIEKLTSSLITDRLFGFFWEVTMSHDYVSYPMVMDRHYERLLSNMKKSGYLDNTVTILMSDHGMRWGKIRNTKQGRLEERLPFVYIILPETFRENYELAYNNIRSNVGRLTTPFDMHETLSDLSDMKMITDAEITARSEKPYTRSRGISLFLPVPGNRTCENAHIDEHWCTCQKGKKLATNHGDVSEASHHLMSHINAMVRSHSQCSRLRLSAILDAVELEASGTDGTEKAEAAWRELTLVVRAEPGGAVFEATLRRAAAWVVAGVSRLNLYGEQSHCVDDFHLKLYCYCR